MTKTKRRVCRRSEDDGHDAFNEAEWVEVLESICMYTYVVGVIWWHRSGLDSGAFKLYESKRVQLK